jgi:hypothetical protein
MENYLIKTEKTATNFIVYLAILSNKKQYVGVTTRSLKLRVEEHLRLSRRKNIKSSIFARAIKKYGIDQVKWEVIDYASSESELFDLEKQWIKELDTFNSGYNLTIGGDGIIGQVHTKETKQKLSEKTKQYFENYDNKIHLAKVQGSHLFNVYKRFTGEFIGQWISKTECAEQLNCGSRAVGKCLLKKYKYHKDYVFIYDEEDTPEKRSLIINPPKKYEANNLFIVFNTDGMEIGVWDNKAKCAVDLDLGSRSKIHECLTGKKNSYKGFVFEYVNNE